MLDEKEKQEIIDAAVEKALLMLPEVVSQLFLQKISMRSLAEQFYADNKQFVGHQDIVASVLEELDSKNPGKKYSDILKDSIPIINERVSLVSRLDLKRPERPKDLSYKGETSDVGEL